MTDLTPVHTATPLSGQHGTIQWRTAQPAAVSRARRSLRRILPDADLGIASTNSTVFGACTGPFRARTSDTVKGDVRGYDARTGKLLWTFRTIPSKGGEAIPPSNLHPPPELSR